MTSRDLISYHNFHMSKPVNGSHILEVTYKVYSYHFDPIALQSSIVDVMAEVALGLAHIKACKEKPNAS
ncbi:hypothetical protein CFP56_000607 [Quercus suber]|uniref:Uncharacterized protein n=1 Tax=Quercus suber TaxID=58331 RepID=A0AAW0IPV3_QUESU